MKYHVGDLIKTVAKKVDFGGKSIKKGTVGYVIEGYEQNNHILYAINFGNIWDVEYDEEELELFRKGEK